MALYIIGKIGSALAFLTVIAMLILGITKGFELWITLTGLGAAIVGMILRSFHIKTDREAEELKRKYGS